MAENLAGCGNGGLLRFVAVVHHARPADRHAGMRLIHIQETPRHGDAAAEQTLSVRTA